MSDEKHHKKIALLAVMLIAAAAMVGVAYANSSTYTITGNTTQNDYVTLTMTTDTGEKVGDSVMFAYEQDYDTFTDNNNNITYRLIAEEKRIKLNENPYTLTISGSKDDAVYDLSAALSGVNALYEDDAGTSKQCKYIVKLTGNGTVYEAEFSAEGIVDFVSENPQKPKPANGNYTFDVYLEMYTTPSVMDQMGPYVTVSKTKFVDKFASADISITFTAEIPAP